jgi:hypothetical protein
MVLGQATFTSLTRMAESADVVSTRLLELLPAADDGMPFDAWSFVRDVLVRGTAIERHCEAKGLGYEQLSARLDAAAREYADRLKPHIKPTEPTP